MRLPSDITIRGSSTGACKALPPHVGREHLGAVGFSTIETHKETIILDFARLEYMPTLILFHSFLVSAVSLTDMLAYVRVVGS